MEPLGLEPRTNTLKGYCSTIELRFQIGTSGRDRTCDQGFRKPLLCPLSYRCKNYNFIENKRLIQIFFLLYVEVWEWQLGHKNFKFSRRLSLLLPLIWSNSMLSCLLFQLLFCPHSSHASFIMLFLFIKSFTIVLYGVESKANKDSVVHIRLPLWRVFFMLKWSVDILFSLQSFCNRL